jgi:hypothetical protein
MTIGPTVGAKTANVEPGTPWGEQTLQKLHCTGPPFSADCFAIACPAGDEFLHSEVFCSLREAQTMIELRRVHDNTVRPHSALGASFFCAPLQKDF